MRPRYAMRSLLRSLWLLLMVPGLAYGQTAAPTDSSLNAADVGAEVKALREALLQTQQQVAAQQQEIEILKAQSKAGQAATGSASPDAKPSDPGSPVHGDDANASSPSGNDQTQQAGQTTSPATIRIGDAVLTPGGFVDFENIYRTTNTQSNIATDFAGIPFSNTAPGSVSEFRTTAQFSRLNFKIEDTF